MQPTRTASKARHAGYAYTQNVTKVFSLVAEDKLIKGQKVTAVLLRELGIPSGDATPVVGTLRDLGLVDDQDCITAAFVRLTKATDKEFETALQKIINANYPDIVRNYDVANITRQELIAVFKNRHYEPKQYPKMASLFIGLADKAGLRTNESESLSVLDDETSDTHISNEQISETEPLTGQETPISDTLQVVEGTPLMVEPPSNSQMNGSLPTSDYSEAEEIGRFLMSLFELPKKPGWTEEDYAWWRLAVSSKAEKIAQLTKEQGGAKQ